MTKESHKAMLKDKIALVSGGGTGIGRAIANELAKNGAKVAIASRNRDQLKRVATELSELGLTVHARADECPGQSRCRTRRRSK